MKVFMVDILFWTKTEREGKIIKENHENNKNQKCWSIFTVYRPSILLVEVPRSPTLERGAPETHSDTQDTFLDRGKECRYEFPGAPGGVHHSDLPFFDINFL